MARALDSALAKIFGIGIIGYSYKPAGGVSHSLLTLSISDENYRDTFSYHCLCVVFVLSFFLFLFFSMYDVQQLASACVMRRATCRVPLPDGASQTGTGVRRSGVVVFL